MKLGKIKLSLMVLSLLAVVACNKNKGDDNVSVSGAGGVTGQYVQGASGLPTGQGNQSHELTAKVTAADATQFTEQVKSLLGASPNFNVNSVGTVSNTTGVDIKGTVGINPQTGAFLATTILGQSKLVLIINDSYSTSGQAQPITINLFNVTTGGASGGKASLTFSDEMGSITVQGTYNASTFQGSVSFTNTQGNRRSGTLGQFTIPTCNFFVCQ
jgi:hypothetical protein